MMIMITICDDAIEDTTMIINIIIPMKIDDDDDDDEVSNRYI